MPPMAANPTKIRAQVTVPGLLSIGKRVGFLRPCASSIACTVCGSTARAHKLAHTRSGWATSRRRPLRQLLTAATLAACGSHGRSQGVHSNPRTTGLTLLRVFEAATCTFEDDRFRCGEQRFETLGLLAGED